MDNSLLTRQNSEILYNSLRFLPFQNLIIHQSITIAPIINPGTNSFQALLHFQKFRVVAYPCRAYWKKSVIPFLITLKFLQSFIVWIKPPMQASQSQQAAVQKSKRLYFSPNASRVHIWYKCDDKNYRHDFFSIPSSPLPSSICIYRLIIYSFLIFSS
jgi:hypothetical protein